MKAVDRRTFLRHATVAAGALTLAGPLQAFAARVARGDPLVGGGYGELVDQGDLWLPHGFQYRVIARQSDMMSDGNPMPSRFDGMAAFAGPDDTTVLMLNHENKRRFSATGTLSPANEIDVVVPSSARYDPNGLWNGGVTKLVTEDRVVIESLAVLGGTTHNCAGGPTPWGSWITCEELFQPPPGSGSLPHGYIFEVDAGTQEAVPAVPIVAGGRFVHEAVAWYDGILYETEDRRDASFYRLVPAAAPAAAGDLAAGGVLEALRLVDFPGLDTRLGGSWPGGVGAAHAIDWVPVPDANPSNDSGSSSVRAQAQGLGAAVFSRTEGCWAADGKILFDCTSGGGTAVAPPNGDGQIFELDPAAGTLELVYESSDPSVLTRPDNLVVAPTTGDVFLFEDSPLSPDPPNHIRGLTAEGTVFDFARAITNQTEFCGGCFDPKGLTMYVNQQGGAQHPGVTYAIWGPWKRRGQPG